MENRGSKIVAIVALCVGVVGLSLGFAAFSNTLTINSSATVTPEADTFKVVFDKSSEITCEGTGTIKTDAIELGDTTISGITAAFTAPEQSVTCTAKIKNAGEYKAFLNEINSGNVSCSSEDATITTDLMNAACDSIVVTATVTDTEGSATDSCSTTKVMANKTISGISMEKGEEQTLTFKIAYNGPARADGTFTVAVDPVTLTYSSVD